MKLTQANYFSLEADRHYLSASQYNSFIGTPVKEKCEAKALAKLNGEWKDERSTAMLVGSYVDAYFDNDLDAFRAENPEIFTVKGDLRSDFKQAEQIIAVAEADPFFIQYVRGSGRSQVIVTGEIGGQPWKGKIDRLHDGLVIVDLKVIASIRDKIWSDAFRGKINFILAYGYLVQAAVYQELWYQMSGDRLSFFIAAITKEKIADKEVIILPDEFLKETLDEITSNSDYVAKIKRGDIPAMPCGACDYCRSIKKLYSAISYAVLYR